MKNKPQAIIFDMDGLLIDSEPLWFDAEKKIFQKVGIDLTPEMYLQTRGLREDEVVAYWFDKYKWQNMSVEEVSNEVLLCVQELIWDKCVLLSGARETIALAKSLGCKIALASSSHMSVINKVLEKFGFEDFDCVHSAEYEIKGKPDPAVYLTVCRKLQVETNKSLAFEDSANGLKAAKAAGMFCIAVPAKEERNDQRFLIADRILDSLAEVNQDLILSLFNK